MRRLPKARGRERKKEAKAKIVGQDPAKRPLLARLFNVLAARCNKEKIAQEKQQAARSAPSKGRGQIYLTICHY